MLPIPENYAIYPSVIPVESPVEMIISPLERGFLFAGGEEYIITAIPNDGNEDNYDLLLSHKSFPVTAKDGVIRFTYTYPEEGQYLFWLIREEKKIAELFVYALEEDLYALTSLRGDFHFHSIRSDGKRAPAALAGHYRDQGYDFFALTDHNRFYPGGEVDAAMLEAQVAYSGAYRDRFLGRIPPVLPSAAIRDFEARARAVHATGPVTKGSRIKPKVVMEKK